MNTDQLLRNNKQFMIKLTQTLYESGENLVVSPFSLISALLMVLAGAHGHSRTELLKILFGIEAKDDNEAYCKSLLNFLADKLQLFLKDNQTVLNKANMLYSHQDFPLNESYVNSLVKQFSAITKQLDFTDKNNALKEINKDVNKATKGLIKTILDNLDRTIHLILINAIHFKGLWKYPFLNESVSDDFTKSNGIIIKVKTMFLEKNLPYCYDEWLKLAAVKIPYTSGSVSMVILLPDHGNDVKNLLTKLEDVGKLNQIFKNMDCSKVRLTLPKFKIEATHKFVPYLNRMGLRAIFDNQANLSGISERPLFVSEIIQKAVIEVNEEGTEAAAVTTVMMTRLCILDYVDFNVNRPFIYFIFSDDDNHILFSGVVEDPNLSL